MSLHLDYSRISPQFWLGETGKSLRGDAQAQVVAFYLMTSPHATRTGVYHCPVLYIAHETGCPLEGASKSLQRLIEGGFCEYEAPSEVVFVIRMAAWQIGERLEATDKRVIGLKREVAAMPSALLKQRFLALYGRPFHLLSTKGHRSPFIAPSKPETITESESDTDSETESETKGVPADVNAVALAMWLQYRAAVSKPVKAPSMQALHKKLAKLGDHAAQLAAVEHSIASQYTGLFAERYMNGSGKAHAPKKTRYEELTEHLHHDDAE